MIIKMTELDQNLGQIGEDYAQQEYIRLGFSIIAKNEYNRKGKRLGEIDFIAGKDDRIVFVEVKSRTEGSDEYGGGVEAVDQYKQRKILLAVKTYLLRNPKYLDYVPQIDVCLVTLSPVDKRPISATIIANAVEDWN
jgi:putative endonuclease